MKQDWKFYLILILSAICLAVIMVWFFLSFESATFQYEMPNGVVCDHKELVTAGFGGAGIEFKRCNDGKNYINPENYRRIR